MPKKSKRARSKRSGKWSRANTLNFVLGGIVAVSMLLGSLFVFGGAPTPSSSGSVVTPTAVVVQTTVVPGLQPGPTATSGAQATQPATPASQATPAVTPTP